jgi:hypothetical protein
MSYYGLDDRGSIPDRGKATCPMSTGGPFPGRKARPGRGADHSPPSSAEFKNEQELYLLSHKAPSWRIAGQLYFLLHF